MHVYHKRTRTLAVLHVVTEMNMESYHTYRHVCTSHIHTHTHRYTHTRTRVEACLTHGEMKMCMLPAHTRAYAFSLCIWKPLRCTCTERASSYTRWRHIFLLVCAVSSCCIWRWSRLICVKKVVKHIRNAGCMMRRSVDSVCWYACTKSSRIAKKCTLLVIKSPFKPP